LLCDFKGGGIVVKVKEFIRQFSIIFIIVYVVSLLVSYLYTILVHGVGIIDWSGSLRLGILFGVIMPAMHLLSKSKSD
jgi:hypothetical protein